MKIEKLDNLRLVWEFQNINGLSRFHGSEKHIVCSLLNRLAPITSDYQFKEWGWETGGEPIIYHAHLYN